MKIVHVIPKSNLRRKIKSTLVKKELELRNRGTTFYVEKGKWKHRQYNGWIIFEETSRGFFEATVHSRSPDNEWQLLQAFIGYLDRHLRDIIHSITIYYG